MGNRIVLCVDDEDTILKSLEMDLTDPDGSYQVEMASNGMEALELVSELFQEGHELAVVISDYIMPEMKGDELLIKLHEDYPTAVTILLTGQSQIEGVTNSINHAALFRYIEKPWQKEDLKLTLSSALQKYDTAKELKQKEQVISEMNKRLVEDREMDDDDAYHPEQKLSDEELYDQIYFSRFFQTLKDKEKKWFARATIGLINSDNKLTKTEMNYLNSIVHTDREKEMVEHYVELIKRKSKPNLEPIRLTNDQKFRFMSYLSQVIISSKRLGKAEEEYFVQIAEQLGADPQATNDCLKIIKHKILGNYMSFKLREYLDKGNPLFATKSG